MGDWMRSEVIAPRGLGYGLSSRLAVLMISLTLVPILGSCGGSEKATPPKRDPLYEAAEARKQAYLEYCVTEERSQGIENEIARLALDKGPLVEEVFYDALDQIAQRLDCSDFRMAVSCG